MSRNTMLSSTLDQRYASSQTRCRRGSLPLKKRRVSLEGFCLPPPQSTLPVPPPPQDCSKMNALSLIAAAAAQHASTSLTSSENVIMGKDQDLQESFPSVRHGKTSPKKRSNSRRVSDEERLHSPKHQLKHQHQSIHTKAQSKYQQRQHQQEQPHIKSFPNGRSTTHASSSSTPVPAAGQQQDKRYTGASDQVRCLATTTRGRACAYACVNGSAYCFLHADYETNPPPRRKQSEAESSMPRAPSTTATTSTARSGKAVRRTTAKLAEKHADSPYPLLSMISTEKWFHKRVKIATGPLQGRCGSVEKWGNGWVSVDVPGSGLHNRRSFELYLEDEGEKCNRSKKVDNQANDQALFRTVSRDVVSPSPSSTDTKGSIGETTTPIFGRSAMSDSGAETPVSLGSPMPHTILSPTVHHKKHAAPKVTPFATLRPMAMPNDGSLDLQLPMGKTSKSIAFRPSMSERTRGRALPKKRAFQHVHQNMQNRRDNNAPNDMPPKLG